MTDVPPSKAATTPSGGRGLRTISTCSYAAWRPEMGTPVRITLGKPKWTPPGRRHWLYVAELAPRGWYFRSDQFDRHYREQLDRLGGDAMAKLAALVHQFGDICLLCFERRVRGPQDCHRRMAAQFISEWLGGIEIPELDPARKEVTR